MNKILIIHSKNQLNKRLVSDLEANLSEWKISEDYKNAGELAEYILITDDQNEIFEANEKGLPVIGWEQEETLYECKFVILALNGIDDVFLNQVLARCKGNPLEIFRTERTIVREFALQDMPALFQLYEDSLMTKFIEPLYPYEEELQYEKDYINFIYGFYGYGLWAIFDRDTGELIGRAGIESKNDLPLDTVELSYHLASKYWRKGIMTEVLQKILQFADEELEMEQVIAKVEVENLPSQSLLLKLGFQPQENSMDQGEDASILVYCKEIGKRL